MILWMVVAAAALIALFAISVYNGLVRHRNQVDNAWSQIDVQLKRRHDLIPNIVNAVKGFLAHERGVLERVTEMRAAAVSAGSDVQARARAENGLTAALRSMFAVSERYPDLTSGQNVRELQEELASTENRVAFSRQHYNDAVMVYNTAMQTFPANMIAGPLGFTPRATFAIDDAAERSVPKVEI